jgi:hypothetical protein
LNYHKNTDSGLEPRPAHGKRRVNSLGALLSKYGFRVEEIEAAAKPAEPPAIGPPWSAKRRRKKGPR